MLHIVVAIFLWSTLGILIKLSGAPVVALMFFSCAISSVIAGSLVFTRKGDWPLPGKKIALSLIVLGAVSLINTFSFFYAYKNTSIANAVLTHYTSPIFVAFIAPFVLKEKLLFRTAASIIIAMIGLWIMLGITAGEFLGLIMSGDSDTIGIAAGLLSGFAYAVLIIIIRLLSPNVHPMVMTFFQNITIAILLTPFVSPGDFFSYSPWVYIIMGVVHSTVAPALYFKGMQKVSAHKTAILGYIEPVCAIALGVLFLNETIGLAAVAGGVMILFSGYLTIRG
jgi:drug/metabolite transporter (DMT)-like permease